VASQRVVMSGLQDLKLQVSCIGYKNSVIVA